MQKFPANLSVCGIAFVFAVYPSGDEDSLPARRHDRADIDRSVQEPVHLRADIRAILYQKRGVESTYMSSPESIYSQFCPWLISWYSDFRIPVKPR